MQAHASYHFHMISQCSMISMVQLCQTFLDALPFAKCLLRAFVFAHVSACFVYAIDAMQSRGLFIEAHIPTHAIVICLWQRRLG